MRKFNYVDLENLRIEFNPIRSWGTRYRIQRIWLTKKVFSEQVLFFNGDNVTEVMQKGLLTTKKYPCHDLVLMKN